MQPEERTCLGCQNLYVRSRKGKKGSGEKYCSIPCRTRHRNLTNNPAKSPEARAKISASRKGKPTTTGRIHSKETRRKISKALKGKPNLLNRRPVSEEVKKKISEALKGKQVGELNPNWRGGTSKRDWKAARYKEFLRQVWAREQGKCQDCSCDESERKLQVHHVLSWIDAPLFRYDPNNGKLLCTRCHRMYDRQPLGVKSRRRIARFAKKRPRDSKGRFITLQPF